MNREIAVALGLARERAGSPSFTRVRDRLRDQIGDPCPSAELLRKWHDPDEVPSTKRLPVDILVALAVIYDVPLSDIGPDLEDHVERMRSLFDRAVDVARRHLGGTGEPPPVVPFRPVTAA